MVVGNPQENPLRVERIRDEHIERRIKNQENGDGRDDIVA
jgi:hypothetical protein